jgi:uncharacterized protein YdeI (YjbR/CyaY-like superfamily)
MPLCTASCGKFAYVSELLAELSKRPGEQVEVLIELDLQFDRFEALAYAERRECLEWIESVREPQTRARRIAGIRERLAAGA